ncbi:hypothetical protein Agub_g13193, partial [Astrephomene gubernaculifera]
AHLTAGVCLRWSGPRPSLLARLAPRLTGHQAAVGLWALAAQQLLAVGEGEGEEGQEEGELEEGGSEGEDQFQDGSDDNDDDEEEEEEEEGEDASYNNSSSSRGSLDSFLASVDCLVRRLAEVAASTAPRSPSSPPPPSLDPGVALIVAEALALLLASPAPAVRGAAEAHLATAATTTPTRTTAHRNGVTMTRAAGSSSSGSSSSSSGCLAQAGLVGPLVSTWRAALRRRHPQQAAVAAAARQLGFTPRLLVTHPLFPLALTAAVELRPAEVMTPQRQQGRQQRRGAVVLLAEAADFASNSAGQPLGPLFASVQLLRERGWRVAVLVAQRWQQLGSAARRTAYLAQLLQAAGVGLEEEEGQVEQQQEVEQEGLY